MFLAFPAALLQATAAQAKLALLTDRRNVHA
jgi:hypothetical protein